MVDARRPQISESRMAGMVETKMRMADTPDARNDASADDIPACRKRRGA